MTLGNELWPPDVLLSIQVALRLTLEHLCSMFTVFLVLEMQRKLKFKGLHGIQLILSSHSLGLELNSMLPYLVSPTCTSSGLFSYTEGLQELYCYSTLYFSASSIMTFWACLLPDDSSLPPPSIIHCYLFWPNIRLEVAGRCLGLMTNRAHKQTHK